MKRKVVLLAILSAVLIGNAAIVELDRLYRVSMIEVVAPSVDAAVGFVQVGLHCPAKGDGKRTMRTRCKGALIAPVLRR